jgi:hypothetical protein
LQVRPDGLKNFRVYGRPPTAQPSNAQAWIEICPLERHYRGIRVAPAANIPDSIAVHARRHADVAPGQQAPKMRP